MTFSIILIALSIERFSKVIMEILSYAWFEKYLSIVHDRSVFIPHWNGIIGVLTVILIPTLITALIISYLNDSIILASMFNLGILLYCLGPGDLMGDIERQVLAWQKGDPEELKNAAQQLELKEIPEDKAELARCISETLILHSYRRFFSILFWFALLGAVGAVLFRVTCLLKEHIEQDVELEDGFKTFVMRTYNIIAWLPAHMTVFLYGLAGDFVQVSTHWRSQTSLPGDEVELFVKNSGLYAVNISKTLKKSFKGQQEEVTSVVGLVWRSMTIFVVIVALAGMFGIIA